MDRIGNRKIVVIEDDKTLRTVLKLSLSREGFSSVSLYGRGDDGLAAVLEAKPSLVLLDVMLPGIDGISVCKKIRSALANRTKIIMLTAKTQDEDIVLGLDSGADDYVTKPFSNDILMARVKAALRSLDGGAATLDGLSFNESRTIASIDGAELQLTRSECKILSLFASRPGRVFTRQQILDAIQEEEKDVIDRVIDVQMVSLRRKLGLWSRHIETIRGVGYRIKP